MHFQYLDRRQQADYLTKERGLPITWRQLQKLAHTGGGPLYRLFGNRAVSTKEWLDEWADQRLSAPRRSTSQTALTLPATAEL